jgi:hypothetical protein
MASVGIYIDSTSVAASISIAFGTATAISANVLTVKSLTDLGAVNTADSTSVITLTQHGVGSVVISSTSLTVSAGVATTSLRGYIDGEVALIAHSSGKTDGVQQVIVYAIDTIRFVRLAGPMSVGSGAGGGASYALLRNTIKINNQTLYRIILWSVESTKRGRGTIRAIIHDAKSIGVSSYLNDAGEIFFTLPYNHDQISECLPLERHYRVDRFDEEDGRYRAISQGLLEDYEAGTNEVVFYGIDYMGVLNKTITTPATTAKFSYTSKTFANIYQTEMSTAITQTDSRLGFIRQNAGTGWSHQATYPLVINSDPNTYSVYTGGESRMGFLSNLANIAMNGTTNKVVFGNLPESNVDAYDSFFCDMKYSGVPNDDITLEYGGRVKDFSYSPNYRKLRTRSLVVGFTSNGSGVYNIWSSVKTSANQPSSTYGVIDDVAAVQDLPSQAAVDARAEYNLYQSGPTKIKSVAISIKDGSLIPFKRYKLGDDIRVRIKRGIVDINSNLTLTGHRYIGNADGSEQIAFEFFTRDALEFNLFPDRKKVTIQDMKDQAKVETKAEKRRRERAEAAAAAAQATADAAGGSPTVETTAAGPVTIQALADKLDKTIKRLKKVDDRTVKLASDPGAKRDYQRVTDDL